MNEEMEEAQSTSANLSGIQDEREPPAMNCEEVEEEEEDEDEESITDIDEDAEDAYTEEDGSIEEGASDSDTDSDTDDTSSNDSEPNEEKTAQRINMEQQFDKLLQEMDTDFVEYEKYQELCRLAKESGSVARRRLSFKRFAKAYPLTPEMWTEYLTLEMSCIQNDQQMIDLKKLYDAALKDYYSFDIAAKCLDWSKYSSDPHKLAKRILTIYGLNYHQGHQLYQNYRQRLVDDDDELEATDNGFTTGILSRIRPENIQHYLDTYVQQLSYPCIGLDECFEEFMNVIEENREKLRSDYLLDFNAIENSYMESKSMCEIVQPFEDHIMELMQSESTEINKHRILQCYLDYVNALNKRMSITGEYEEDNDDNSTKPTILLLYTIYERMAIYYWSNEKFWLDYVAFLQQIKRDTGRTRIRGVPIMKLMDEVTIKSLRNCFWSVVLYRQRMQMLVMLRRDVSELKALLENGLATCSTLPQNTLNLWLDYLTTLKRLTDFKDEGSCEFLRKNFDHAITSIGIQWPNISVDPDCLILQMWANLEYGPLNNPKRGKDLWATVLDVPRNAKKAIYWMQYINLELGSGDINSARRLYQKALNTGNLDDNYTIAKSWELFERCYGTHKTLDLFLKKYDIKWSERNESNKGIRESNKRKESSHNLRNREDGDRSEPVPKKARSSYDNKNNEQKKNKKRNDKGQQHDDDNQEAIREAIGTGSNKRNKSPPSQRVEEQQPYTRKISEADDNVCVFLSNLDYNLNEDDIRQGLPDLKILEIDLIRSGNGRSRGFAYVKLENEEEVKRALSLDRKFISERPVYISTVTRDKNQRQKFKYSDELEPSKLFIRGLPSDTTKEDLEKLFGPYGTLKDIRLVHHKSGKFKNLAYVEYEKETSASKALLATDQLSFRDHTLSVAISAPPLRASGDQDMEGRGKTTNFLLGGRRPPQHEQRPRMSLIPTVVRNNFMSTKVKDSIQETTISSREKGEEVAENKPQEKSRKSNEDFRKMLLK